MDRIVVFVLGLFLFALALAMTTKAPASIEPIHTSSIRVEIESNKLQLALQLLDKHPEYKEYVESHIDVIRQGRLSQVIGGKEVVFEITPKYINEQTLEWLASTFVHEARHVENHRLGKVMTQQENEIDAMRVQATALYYMGGKEYEIADLLTQNGLHFDTNGNGILDPEDNWEY